MSVIESRATLELVQTYRRVFNSDDGRKVLEDILGDLKHFSTGESDQDLVLQNYAKLLLFKVGGLLDQNLGGLIAAYLSFPISTPTGDKENIDG